MELVPDVPETVFPLSLNRPSDQWTDQVAIRDWNQNKKQKSNKQHWSAKTKLRVSCSCMKNEASWDR